MAQRIISLGLLILISSCSWFTETNRKYFGGGDNEVSETTQVDNKPKSEEANSKKPVSYEEYIQLKNKYDALVQAKEAAKSVELAETVDVLGDSGVVNSIINEKKTELAKSHSKTNNQLSYLNTKQHIESEMNLYEKGLGLIKVGELKTAITIFKQLEKSPNRQLGVRAKFMQAEIFIAQKEYDLAMQVLEDIVENQAFSGVILQTLAKLVYCCDQLGLLDKKEKYNSILKDIFEVS